MLGTMLAEIAEIVERAPPAYGLPRAPLFPLAWMNEQIARAIGRTPFLTVDSLRMAKHRMFFSSAKAEPSSAIAREPYRQALVDAHQLVSRGRDDPMICEPDRSALIGGLAGVALRPPRLLADRRTRHAQLARGAARMARASSPWCPLATRPT